MKVSYGSSLEPILEIWPQTFGEKTFGNFNHYAIQILGERTGANLGFPFPPIPRHFSFAEVREFSVVDVTPHPVTIGWMGSAADAEAEKVQALEHWYALVELGVSENSVPLNPMVLLIIIPIKWLFHWEYTQHFQTNPVGSPQNWDKDTPGRRSRDGKPGR